MFLSCLLLFTEHINASLNNVFYFSGGAEPECIHAMALKKRQTDIFDAIPQSQHKYQGGTLLPSLMTLLHLTASEYFVECQWTHKIQ